MKFKKDDRVVVVSSDAGGVVQGVYRSEGCEPVYAVGLDSGPRLFAEAAGLRRAFCKVDAVWSWPNWRKTSEHKTPRGVGAIIIDSDGDISAAYCSAYGGAWSCGEYDVEPPEYWLPAGEVPRPGSTPWVPAETPPPAGELVVLATRGGYYIGWRQGEGYRSSALPDEHWLKVPLVRWMRIPAEPKECAL